MMKKGIDISEWQTGLDYTTMARNLDFVILREGYKKSVDKMFLTHVAGFRALKVPIIGVYHFLYALTVDQAREEALSCIRNVEKAKLPKTTRIWADFEYDTVDKAKAKGVALGTAECRSFTQAFCETVTKAGYPTGIYTNEDYARNMYGSEFLSGYPLWYAQYGGSKPLRDCLVWQYSSTGRINGFPEILDMDYFFDEQLEIIDDGSEDDQKTMGVTAEQVLNVYRSWIGLSRSAGTHIVILDIYNKYVREHPGSGRGYQVQKGDAFCDTTLSAAFIKLDAVGLIGGVECGGGACQDL